MLVSMTTVVTATQAGVLGAIQIKISIQTRRGMPELRIQGLGSRLAQSSKERVLMALHSSGYKPKAKRTIITIANDQQLELAKLHHPAGLEWLDMAIAIAIIQENSGKTQFSESTACIGAVGIDGSVNGGSELIPQVLAAKKVGCTSVLVPEDTARACRWITGLQILSVGSLAQLHSPRLWGHQALSSTAPAALTPAQIAVLTHNPSVSRALVLTAAGGHHTLLIGPPGWGKTTAAQALSALLPPLTEEMLEQAMVESSQHQYIDQYLQRIPVVVCLHPTTNQRSLFAAAGNHSTLTANHFGISILDELPLYQQATLLGLRQYLDQQQHDSTREHAAHNTIVGTGNPCSCGQWGSKQRCHCTRLGRVRYWQRVGEALIDRFQLYSWVDPSSQTPDAPGLQLETERKAIVKARVQQADRYGTTQLLNAQASWDTLLTTNPQLREIEQQLAQISYQFRLSKRSQLHLLRIARTIADLEARMEIECQDILQALQFRKQLRMLTAQETDAAPP